MGIMFGMFWLAFWVVSTQKCEAVNLALFGSACMHARPLKDLEMLVLHRACVPCMHAGKNGEHSCGEKAVRMGSIPVRGIFMETT